MAYPIYRYPFSNAILNILQHEAYKNWLLIFYRFRASAAKDVFIIFIRGSISTLWQMAGLVLPQASDNKCVTELLLFSLSIHSKQHHYNLPLKTTVWAISRTAETYSLRLGHNSFNIYKICLLKTRPAAKTTARPFLISSLPFVKRKQMITTIPSQKFDLCSMLISIYC